MKLSTLLKTSALLLLVVGLNNSHAIAQNSRNVSVKTFNGVTVSSGIDLYITQGTNEALTIKGEDNLIKNVVVEQSGSVLTIKYKEGLNWGSMFKNQSIKVYLNYKTLKSLSASGGSDVYTQNNLKADILNLKASGGADLKLTLSVKDLTLTISGGSDAELKGSGENLQATASGGSDIDAFGYVVNNARVTVSGGSDANIYVNKALEAGASGGSDVNYKGSAVLKKTSSSKSGDVHHVN
ncbi:DUF2807 domain-containing protein [Pedobacter polaris]|uniref:DUF2807 domain-containing protein n=1 Tax=Pedobacter polaris TaxID=2571273 RepID=A0A4V5NYN4_9SPHI|nr:head GIN domain-containing protein [Pedobacter polaris]TKC04771.1 DUF2807 domain-containing protein [Pedobacter polaris]